jgi:hypothetical protein
LISDLAAYFEDEGSICEAANLAVLKQNAFALHLETFDTKVLKGQQVERTS